MILSGIFVVYVITVAITIDYSYLLLTFLSAGAAVFFLSLTILYVLSQKKKRGAVYFLFGIIFLFFFLAFIFEWQFI